ncbi:anti-sigma factor [Arthrobacter sp. zg-Y40]|uniref:anti-sigma factor n=1 Tax=Arthrobacter sp. zg-Y40 TaxID=2886939 RepID=UPI001D148D8A|nr:anti-sigma factor [Arthrobacter sp. zg-Y40]MCC3278995.1 anti-sigma factor [Arthrobacter sp. zg-Y40]
MQHLSSEALALNALGEGTAEETAHLQQCTQCTAEVEALGRVVTAGRAPAAGALPHPQASVWEGIHSSLGLGDAVRRDPFDTPPASDAAESGPAREQSAPAAEPQASPVSLDAARSRRNRRRLPQILAAAAAAVVLAAAGTWGISRILADRTEVIAAVDLAPLPAYQDTGRAEVDQRADGGRELVVTASGADAQGFREVWLIAPDIERMVSLGTMEGTEGRFTIPANLDLNEYPIVDISDEPFDGNPTHSGDSILRGVLEP